MGGLRVLVGGRLDGDGGIPVSLSSDSQLLVYEHLLEPHLPSGALSCHRPQSTKNTGWNLQTVSPNKTFLLSKLITLGILLQQQRTDWVW